MILLIVGVAPRLDGRPRATTGLASIRSIRLTPS